MASSLQWISQTNENDLVQCVHLAKGHLEHSAHSFADCARVSRSGPVQYSLFIRRDRRGRSMASLAICDVAWISSASSSLLFSAPVLFRSGAICWLPVAEGLFELESEINGIRSERAQQASTVSTATSRRCADFMSCFDLYCVFHSHIDEIITLLLSLPSICDVARISFSLSSLSISPLSVLLGLEWFSDLRSPRFYSNWRVKLTKFYAIELNKRAPFLFQHREGVQTLCLAAISPASFIHSLIPYCVRFCVLHFLFAVRVGLFMSFSLAIDFCLIVIRNLQPWLLGRN